MYNNVAKKLGIPVATIRRVMFNLDKKESDARLDASSLQKLEKRLVAQLQFLFIAQMDLYIKRLNELAFFNRKGVVYTKDIEQDINTIFENDTQKPKIVEAITSIAALSMIYGFRRVRKDHKEALPFPVDLQNFNAVQYLQGLRALHLSQFKGSISLTTEQRIRDIISNGLNKSLTYTEIANEIRKQSTAGVFSKARAQTIALDQTSKAYAYGQKVQMDTFIQRTAARVEKYWSTVRDLKVSQTICAPNEAQGWLLWNELWQSGNDMTPGHVNCRCGVITRII